MKNFRNRVSGRAFPLTKCLKLMKLTILFMVIGLLQVSASLYSQTTRLKLELRNTRVIDVLDVIEKQTELRFAYSPGLIDLNKRISVNINEKNLEETMDIIFQDTGIRYLIKDRHVMLYPEDLDEQGNESAVQQPTGVTGKVTDKAGMPLPGVTVVIKGTTIGTITGTDGDYRISGTSPSSVLVFSFVGMRTQEIQAGSQSTINVILQDETIGIEEVVAVGYGTQKKVNLTGAVSTVKGAELSIVPLASTTNALTGRISGLITTQQSGQPGADGAFLSIRGFGSPLVIVDGVESSFNNIDANEIESVSVLKDASAAIYGARAGNGVVLVTTKRGNLGKPTISLNSSWTFQGLVNMLKPLSAGDYTRLSRDNYLQTGKNAINAPYTEEEVQRYYSGEDPDYPSTNWFDEVVRPYAPSQQHNLSLRGGNESIKYYGFAGLLDQETMIKTNGGNYGRYNLRSNIDAKILDNLSMNVDLSTIMEERNFPIRTLAANDTKSNVWYDLWQTRPTYPATLPDKDGETMLSYADGNGTGGAHLSTNREIYGFNDQFDQKLHTQASLNWDIIKGLSLKGTYTYDKANQRTKRFNKKITTYEYNYASDKYIPHPISNSPILNQSASESWVKTAQLMITYDRVFAEKHTVSLLGVGETIETAGLSLAGQREGYATDQIPYLFAGGVENQRANGDAYEMGRASLIGRANYSYLGKYLVEATIRRDGSAQFPENSRWGLFPSISLGWRLSEESFIKNTIGSFVSNLKLRGGFSQTGNDYVVSSFPYLTGFGIRDLGYVIGDKTLQSYYTKGLPNPELTWETMTLYNSGLDFGFLNNKIYGEIDVFYRLREGILGTRNLSVPNTFGATLPVENLNSQDTRGFEISFGYKDQIGEFKYDITGNVSWSRSKWISFDEPIYTDPDDIRMNKRTGQWTDRTFGYISDGLFTSLKDIYYLPYQYNDIAGKNNSLNKGDIRLLNQNGDDVLDWRDKVELGQGSTPHWMVGINSDFRYKGFNLTMLWQGALGFYKNISTVVGHNETTFKYRWTDEENRPYALIPRIGTNAGYYWGATDYFLKPSDYLRLKSISFGYSIPGSLLKNLKIQEMRLFFAGTNLFTFSALNLYNIDPEAPSGNVGYYYPQAKTISFGFNVSL
jgi:TonB-linked SusC/RagA family outer membrane protein